MGDLICVTMIIPVMKLLFSKNRKCYCFLKL